MAMHLVSLVYYVDWATVGLLGIAITGRRQIGFISSNNIHVFVTRQLNLNNGAFPGYFNSPEAQSKRLQIQNQPFLPKRF